MTESAELNLSKHLADMLTAHGVAAELVEGAVLVGEERSPAWLWAVPATSGRGWLLSIEAVALGGTRLVDTWMGMGQTEEEAVRDGLQAFSRGTFHVLLAGIWGVLEPEQVDHEVVSGGEETWDLYVGGGPWEEARAMPRFLFRRDFGTSSSGSHARGSPQKHTAGAGSSRRGPRTPGCSKRFETVSRMRSAIKR